MKHLRYKGEFYSRRATLCRAEIWQESAQEYPAVGRMDFPAEEALEIEWNSVDKLEPVHSSCATLTVVSRTDRQYIDMYTVEAGSIRLDVYRENSLYWSGTLDTELYSEPFSYENEYEVQLTFSDFALLGRLNFTDTGYKTLQQIINDSLAASCIRFQGTASYISTSRKGDPPTGTLLASTCINCGNFYDEDDKPMTLRQVLDETLRPFSLHLKQKAGQVFVYDLNAVKTLFETRGTQPLEWDSDDAVLGADKVYKNVKVTFSPYEKRELIQAEMKTKGMEHTESEMVDKDLNSGIEGFQLEIFKNTPPPASITWGGGVYPFKIESIFSGNPCAGIAALAKTKERKTPGAPYHDVVAGNPAGSFAWLIKINKRTMLPYITYSLIQGTNGGRDFYVPDVMMRLKMDMLADVRYNPFEEPGQWNENGDYERMKNNVSAVFVPFRLRVRNEKGEVCWHYRNVQFNNYADMHLAAEEWKEGDYPEWADNPLMLPPYALLAFYSPNREQGSTQCYGYPGGWQTCRQCLPKMGYNHIRMYDKMGAGQFIKIPAEVYGTVEIEITQGIYSFSNGGEKIERGLYNCNDCVRWLLYQMPQVEMVDRYGREIHPEDIEYNSWLNVSAKEELKIDTLCGSGNAAQVRGMGVLLRTEDRKPVGQFTRNGLTDCLEKLLVGTVYSNYARRMNTLGGTVKLLPDFALYTDRSEPGYYLPVEELQNMQEETSCVKVVQIEKDHYQGADYIKE